MLLTSAPDTAFLEHAARRFERKGTDKTDGPRWSTPGELARTLDRRVVQTPALDLIDAELVRLANTPGGRLIISMPPQEGKSQRASRAFPLWMLTQRPETRIAIVSYAHPVARRFGRTIRDDVINNSPTLGMRVRDDISAQHEWQLDGHEGGVYSVGIGGSLTSRPVDCVSADTAIECEYGQLTAAQAFDRGIKRILAYDHAARTPVWRDVEAARRIPGRQVVEVVTTSGRVLTCTPDHRVYTSRGYVPARDLRAGDSLVAILAPGGVPMREHPCGAEDDHPRGDPARDEPLLRADVHDERVLDRKPHPVLPLRQPDPAKPRTVLLGRVRAGEPAAADTLMPAVRYGVSSQVVSDDVLHPPLRQPGALLAHDRAGQLPVQDRDQLRALVQADAAADPGTRPRPVRDVQRGPHADLHMAKQDRHALGAGDPPHRRGRTEQPTAEPHHTLRQMPHGAPQVEADTVAVVRHRGDATVDVYDFQVAGTRNFFGNGVLVHNCLIIDDPIKDREQADSETYREKVWDWWTDVGQTRLAPDAPVVLILTRWHHDDLAGRLLAAEDGHRWRVVNLQAEADHRPEKGEVDPLGREPGEFLESARGRTREQWQAIKITAGPRTWGSLYQGRPTPEVGDLFPGLWARYERLLWVPRDDGARIIPGGGTLIQSWDMAFKDTKGSDYVVGQVWWRDAAGVNAFLVDQVRARMSFTETCERLVGLSAKWPQATAKLVEDKANGPAVMNALAQKVAGMLPVEPMGSKYARASAVSPLVHSGNVKLPPAEVAPWVEDFLEEARGFPHEAHDDQIDAFSQAVNYLLLSHLAISIKSPLKAAGQSKAAQRYMRRTMSG